MQVFPILHQCRDQTPAGAPDGVGKYHSQVWQPDFSTCEAGITPTLAPLHLRHGLVCTRSHRYVTSTAGSDL
ncbi:hypothetical protein INR49_032887 [Caranx melampygus]|nr:hypothetical protein INR49_032887 [Caranx melampygus]